MTRPGILPPGIAGHNRTMVTPHYAVMPPQGILESRLPGFADTLVRFQTSPRMGARFAQCLLELAATGRTTAPRRDPQQHFLYVTGGQVLLGIGTETQRLEVGGFAYIPAGAEWTLRADGGPAQVLWIRKPYESLPGIHPPPARFGRRADVPRTVKHTEGRYWQYLLGSGGMEFDMEVNILGFAPGTYFPYVETHIMEHGLYMLEGQGLYLLGREWHECWTGDFIWMGPYVPQQFYCTGWGEAAYLLYKDVNRDVAF